MPIPLVLCSSLLLAVVQDPGVYEAELIFPLRTDHNHAPGLVELPNGDLLASWYRGSGERKADDVAVYGARKRHDAKPWGQPFVMADTPGFPDGNTCMMIDDQERLWLFWPTVLANTWESCLTNYRVSSDYQSAGPPVWRQRGLVLLKPADFQEEVEGRLQQWLGKLGVELSGALQEELRVARTRLGDKLYQRLGWQPRCKPTVLASGRWLLPLYTDTFSISIMAISDDQGRTWRASRPLIGFGNIQPSVLAGRDGRLTAFMRENGATGRIRVAYSTDDGESWSNVEQSDLPNPGSGLDAVRLSNGNWVLVYNDTARGRQSLAVSLSDDDGATWKWTRHLESAESGSFHYPCVIQSRAGDLHAVYSYFVAEGKSMKHVHFNEDWIRQGDSQ